MQTEVRFGTRNLLSIAAMARFLECSPACHPLLPQTIPVKPLTRRKSRRVRFGAKPCTI